jgi:vanillate O-demethylase monooxygenase subunit
MIEQFRIAFNEDKAILEAIQRKERELRGRHPIRLAIDTGTIRMRQMVESMMKSESASTRASDASAA